MGDHARGGGGCCLPMDLMRSEAMQLVQLIIPTESTHLTISYLGDLGLLQFKDLNAEKSPFQRAFANQIKRCGEMARKLRFFREKMAKAGTSPSSMPMPRTHIDLDDLEIKLGDLEAEVIEVSTNSEKLQRTYNELLEYLLVLKKEMLMDPSKQVKLGFVSGLVPKEKSMAFERILLRGTRGNVFLKQAAVDDPVTDRVSGVKVAKNVFVVFFSGERAKTKILKICEAFGANRYPFTEDMVKQMQMIEEVSGESLSSRLL